MNGDKRFRVYNRCKYDIGVTLTSGQQVSIQHGSFQPLSVDDILYIESICRKKKFFSKKMLVAVSEDGKDLALEDLGGYADQTSLPHMNDEEIISGLKRPFKSFESWIKGIDDPEELHAIYEVAKTLDLPASKLKILKAKAPTKDWLGEDD